MPVDVPATVTVANSLLFVYYIAGIYVSFLSQWEFKAMLLGPNLPGPIGAGDY